ncbi:MAG: hypothetical protein K2O61_06520, partial [Bacteroidaceae bacterium]|nr:hypothetical protein [Bacteroidaceae bacterium]
MCYYKLSFSVKSQTQDSSLAVAFVVLNFAITRMPFTRGGADVLLKKAAQRYGFCPSQQKFFPVFLLLWYGFCPFREKKEGFLLHRRTGKPSCVIRRCLSP